MIHLIMFLKDTAVKIIFSQYFKVITQEKQLYYRAEKRREMIMECLSVLSGYGLTTGK